MSRAAEVRAAVLALVRVQGVEAVFDGVPIADNPVHPAVVLRGEAENRDRVTHGSKFIVATKFDFMIGTRSADQGAAVQIVHDIFDRIEIAVGADPLLGLGPEFMASAYITDKVSDHGEELAGAAFVQFTLEVTYRRPVGTP